MLSQMKLTYYCDQANHLICTPYTIDNLHRMADELGIRRLWFHADSNFPHYNLPKKRIAEIKEKCIVVDARRLVEIIKCQIEVHGKETGLPQKKRYAHKLARLNTPLGVKEYSRRKVSKVVS